MAVITGGTVARDATGNVEDFLNGTFRNCTPGECMYGLQNSFQVSLIQVFTSPSKRTNVMLSTKNYYARNIL